MSIKSGNLDNLNNYRLIQKYSKRICNYKERHKGETIYVIASGKSTDYIDSDFFSNKITIGVNQTYKKYVPTYLVRTEHQLLDQILALQLETTHFISKGDCGKNYINSSTYNFSPEIKHQLDNKNIVLYDHESNSLSNIRALPDNDNTLIASNSTITTAIHLAAYMGARYIILVGHDCGSLDDELNFSGYHDELTYGLMHENKIPQENYKSWLTSIESQMIKFKFLLKEKYGCDIYSLNPIVNMPKKITIITPSYRINNLKKIKEHINFDYVNEWIIVYDGNKVAENPKLFDHAKIKEYILKDETGHWGNLQRNYALDNISITDTYLYFLDDDNIIHPHLYRLLDIIEKNKLYTFNQESANKDIWVKGDVIKIGKVDTGSMIIDYNLCKDIRWDNNCNPEAVARGLGDCADGYYICECYNKNKDKWIYIDTIFGYYNKLV